MCEVNVPRQKVPKDGVGPRGVPECYYTSRVLNSTFRYVKFIRKLRAFEEEQRKGAENKAKEAKDWSINEFFMKCDRNSLINDVARRVDLSLDSYQKDLEAKRQKLRELFAHEEEDNTRKFVAQAQEGAELVWQDKKERLRFLLEKRKKEHAEKYKDTPLSKCVHVLPCILKLRAMEAQQIQLYQMKEKQARKMAEIEFDKMWHEVTMKEADALAARMEYDAIERYRRDMECKQYSDYQIEQNRRRRERDREMLRQEALRFKALWDAENQKEDDAEQARRDKAKEVAADSNRFLKLNQERLARESEEEKKVSNAWNSLANQGMASDIATIELWKRKERELDECNRRLLEMKKQFVDMEIQDDVIRKADARLMQKKKDEASCRYLKWAKDTTQEVRKGMIEQMKDREEEKKRLKKRIEEEDEFHRQLREQLDKLVDHRDKVDAKIRKDHQRNLVKQIEYNNLLKERAKQEELDQVKKYAIATKEYEDEIQKMLCRPFFSDHIHPFMKQMAKGIKMADKCPCSKKDYCE